MGVFAILGIIPASTFSAVELIKFVPLKSHQVLANSTFPRIEVTYPLDCNQRFHKVVREEISNEILGGKVFIYIGVLVIENVWLDCIDVTQDVKVDAGHAYSGRDYEINYILK